MPDAIGPWRLRDVAPDGGDRAELVSGAGEGWIAAEAPGDTYRALIAAGRLADPYVGRNEAGAAWVREREWWWHAPLDLADGDAVDLVFDGLDTFAEVYLDGALLGRADNMFRSWRFDLSGTTPGPHDLAVRFRPTAAMTGDAPLPVWSSFADRISVSRRTLMRKAQFGWGWDWGPDLPTVGIWRPVRIERPAAVAIESVNFATVGLADGLADVIATVDVSTPVPVTVELFDRSGARVACGKRHGGGDIALRVHDPALWWTADLGDQPLYTLVARAGGSELTRQVGIRTIVLDQSHDPDEPGSTFFRFVLNGVPLFAKGANWVPASSFVGAIPDDTYRDLLERAVAANMNMIRVWGGGIYEPDLFYDLCDRLGLLLWQDFMFACAPYPEDEPFLANVRAEVTEQVARLRHHACLALWCGNNENQALQWFEDMGSGHVTPLAGQVIYDGLVPDILASADPLTPYWPGSPWGGPSPNSMRAGDVHDWTVWHGVPPVPDALPVGDFDRSPEGLAYTRYGENRARFVSEFGIQAAPEPATLRRWMAPEDFTLRTPGFLERIKDLADKLTAMMLPVTGAPTTMEHYIEHSMMTQAEGLAFGIEHFRRRAPHCSGALIWQHNDCWPCVSWSLVDYDGVAKPSFHAVTRAFAPVMACFRRDGDHAELWVVNDTRSVASGEVTVALVRLEAGADWSERIAIHVPPHTSRCVWRRAIVDANDRILTVRGDGLFPDNRVLLAAPKDLALSADPGLTWRHEPEGDTLRVYVGAEHYALGVRLRSDDPALRFDTGHLDLAAGQEVCITATHRDGLRIDPDAITATCWNPYR